MIYSDNELSFKSLKSLKIDVPKLGKLRNLKPPPLPPSPAFFSHQPLFSHPLHSSFSCLLLSSTPILSSPTLLLNPHSPISPPFHVPRSSCSYPLHFSIPILPFAFPSLLHFPHSTISSIPNSHSPIPHTSQPSFFRLPPLTYFSFIILPSPPFLIPLCFS